MALTDILLTLSDDEKGALEERFWRKVRRGATDQCWEWLGCRSRGYGRIRIEGSTILAHRVSFMLTYGELPDNACVCHSCDNPACVNPSHLFLGNHRDNMHDMIAKSRNAFGERHWRSKVDDETVRQICTLYQQGTRSAELSMLFGISPMTVSEILSGKSWKHVERPIDTTNKNVKVTTESLIAIRERLRQGIPQRAVAREFSVSQATISAIATNRYQRRVM